MKKYFKGFLMAISMFTIIPLPKYEWDDEGGKNIMKFYPVIGLIVGVIWYGVFRILNLLGASIMVTTAVTLITPFILTGMLHLDGYMDVCDALLSRRDKQEKLRILKDPHTGAFAVISVIMLFILNSRAYSMAILPLSAKSVLVAIPTIRSASSAIFPFSKSTAARLSPNSSSTMGRFEAITGRPCAIASINTNGIPSHLDAKT